MTTLGMRQRFGRYVALESHLHRLDPVVKISIFALLLVSIFLAGAWVHLAYVSAYILVLCLISKAGLAFYVDSLKYFAWMFALSLLINVAFPKGVGTERFSLTALSIGGIFSVRLALMILAATVMTVVTPPSEIGDSVLLLSRLKGRVGRRAAEFAALLSISMRFVPVMFEEAERIKAAQVLRGGSVSGLRDRVRFAVGLIVPLVGSSLRRAENLGFALEARCYGYCIPTSPGLRLGKREVIFGIGSIVVLLGLVMMR